MAYMDCPECGKTMLSIATQCPHCGYQFPPQQLRISIPPPQVRKVRPAVTVALALVVVAAVVVAFQSWGGWRAGPESGVATVPPRAPSGEQQQQPVETTVPDTAAVGAIRQDSQPQVSVAETTPAVTTPPPALPPPAALPTGQQTRRYASTWVNVRRDRGREAPTVRVLQPGDAVLVDSLDQGWYRVVIDGQPIGYAHRANLVVRAP